MTTLRQLRSRLSRPETGGQRVRANCDPEPFVLRAETELSATPPIRVVRQRPQFDCPLFFLFFLSPLSGHSSSRMSVEQREGSMPIRQELAFQERNVSGPPALGSSLSESVIPKPIDLPGIGARCLGRGSRRGRLPVCACSGPWRRRFWSPDRVPAF